VGIVRGIAGTKRRGITDEDVRGLKYFRVLQPLLERLHRTGTERDTAGNRRLFMDQYCMLVLLGLFSPAIDSLRTLQRASTLDKVRKRLGCSRASLGSLSESVAIFDPTRLKQIAAELGSQVPAKSAGRFAAVAQHLTAVDGTVIESVKRVAELSWTPLSGGRRLSAYRLQASVLHQAQRRGDPDVLRDDRLHADPDLHGPTAGQGDAPDGAVLSRRLGEHRGT
jgi:hypothetical protein